MNSESLGLVIFAFIALAAVFAFIILFGGPQPTGDIIGESRGETSWHVIRDPNTACGRGSQCSDGLPGVTSGNYDPVRDLYECKCQTSEPSYRFFRSRIQ